MVCSLQMTAFSSSFVLNLAVRTNIIIIFLSVVLLLSLVFLVLLLLLLPLLVLLMFQAYQKRHFGRLGLWRKYHGRNT